MIKNGWIVSDGLLISNNEVAALELADDTLSVTLKGGKTFQIKGEDASALWDEYMKKADASWQVSRRALS